MGFPLLPEARVLLELTPSRERDPVHGLVITLLKSTLVGPPTSVDSKGFTEMLSPLESALTK